MPRATQLLRDDHQKVQQLFTDFEKSDDRATKKRIAETVIHELQIHSKIEEEIYYPAVRRSVDDGKEIVTEATVEHHVVDLLIAELQGMRPSAVEFDATFKVLSENVRHHIKEEESEMLPDSEHSGLDLDALGERMMERKEELMNGSSTRKRAARNGGRGHTTGGRTTARKAARGSRASSRGSSGGRSRARMR